LVVVNNKFCTEMNRSIIHQHHNSSPTTSLELSKRICYNYSQILPLDSPNWRTARCPTAALSLVRRLNKSKLHLFTHIKLRWISTQLMSNMHQCESCKLFNNADQFRLHLDIHFMTLDILRHSTLPSAESLRIMLYAVESLTLSNHSKSR
jgi:hypothetical protein